MKTATLLLALASLLNTASAATTINSANKFAYGANIGWMDWRGDVASGAVVGEFVCSGFIYSANVGWIDLGDGTPGNGIRYQNMSAGDFGVNHDGAGTLSGFAYGANIGWIHFTNAHAGWRVVRWPASGRISPDSGPTTTRSFADAVARHRFFRMEAVRPLTH